MTRIVVVATRDIEERLALLEREMKCVGYLMLLVLPIVCVVVSAIAAILGVLCAHWLSP